jgi:hypothetical protein
MTECTSTTTSKVSKMTHYPRNLIAAAAVCIFVVSCGTDVSGSPASGSTQVSDEEAVTALVEGLNGAWNVADRVYPWRSLSETLPTVTFNVADGPQMSASDVIAVGRVTSVVRGRALIYDQNYDGAPPTEVPFDDPSAMYRTIGVTMSVDETIGPSDGVGETVTWEAGVGPPSTFDVYAQGWQAMGRIVVFLSRSDFTPMGVYALSEVGSLVLPLDGEHLTFPVLLESGDPAVPPKWFDGIKTLDDLRAAVQEGPRTIDVGPSPHFER